MHDVQNQHHIVLRDTVKDDLIASGEAAHTRTQIATPSSHVWIPGQQPKALVDALHHPCGKIDAAGIAGHVNPDAVKLGFRLGRKTELAHRRRFCSAESRAMPRRLMSSVSCVTPSCVVILRPSPRAKDASACSTAATISNRRRSRSSQSDMASRPASSWPWNRPASMPWRISVSATDGDGRRASALRRRVMLRRADDLGMFECACGRVIPRGLHAPLHTASNGLVTIPAPCAPPTRGLGSPRFYLSLGDLTAREGACPE